MGKIKALQIRIPQELWVFAKKRSIDREMSLNTLIIDLLDHYKKKYEKRLTSSDTMVSFNNKEDK